MGGLMVEVGGGERKKKKKERRYFLRPFATSLTPFPDQSVTLEPNLKFTLRYDLKGFF